MNNKQRFLSGEDFYFNQKVENNVVKYIESRISRSINSIELYYDSSCLVFVEWEKGERKGIVARLKVKLDAQGFTFEMSNKRVLFSSLHFYGEPGKIKFKIIASDDCNEFEDSNKFVDAQGELLRAFNLYGVLPSVGDVLRRDGGGINKKLFVVVAREFFRDEFDEMHVYVVPEKKYFKRFWI